MAQFRTIRIALTGLLMASTAVVFQAGGAQALTGPVGSKSAPLFAQSGDAQKRAVAGAATHALWVRAIHVGGAEVRQGRSKAVNTEIKNDTQSTVKGVKVEVAIPPALNISVNTPDWSCKGGKTRLMTCRLATPMQPGTEHSFTMKVSAERDAIAGRHTITVTPSAKGKPLAEADSFDVNVVDRGSAVIEPVIDYTSKSVSTSGVVLSTQTAYVNKEFKYNLKLRNIGHERLMPGERVKMTQSIGKNIRVVSVTSKRGEKCAIQKKSWSCVFTAKRVVQPGQNLDSVNVVVVPTKSTVRMALGQVSVRTQGVKKAQVVTPLVGVKQPDDIVKIHTKSFHRTHEGGAMRVRVVLENISKSAIPSNHAMEVKLPKGLTLAFAKGASWKCSEPKTDTPQTFNCTFGKALRAGALSTRLKVVARLSPKISPSPEPLTVDFGSSAGRTAYKFSVEAAPSVKAVARLGQFEDGEYVIDLAGEAMRVHETAHKSQWIQRCTTARDAKSRVCPSGAIAPQLELANKANVNAQAFVPANARPQTFVFEYRAITPSVTKTRIVKVKMPSSNVRSANVVSATRLQAANPPVTIPGIRNPGSDGSVSGADTSTPTTTPMTIPSTTSTVAPSNGAVKTTTTPIIPTSVLHALANYGVTTTKAATVSPTSSTVYNQVGTLRGNVGRQFSVFGSVITINYSLTDTVACAQASLDTSAMSFLSNQVSATDFVIVAPKTDQSSCTYKGTSVTKGMVFFTLNIFGDSLTFNSEIDPDAFMGYLNLTTKVATLDYPLANSHVTFKNVSVTIRIDMALKTGGILLGIDTKVFGTTLTLGGLLTVDGRTQQLTGDLVMAQTKDIVFDGVTVSDLMVGIGVSATGLTAPVTLNILGSGKLQFLGETIDIREISFDFLGSEIVAARIDFALHTKMKGTYDLNGDFTFQWRAAPSPTKKNPNPEPKIEITSTVQFNAGGFEIGSIADPAQMTWTSTCFTLRGKVIIPSIMSVDVAGLYMLKDGFCDNAGSTFGVGGMFAMVPRPGIAGDFRFDATNMELNLPEIDVDGAFSFGEFFSIPYSSINLKFAVGTSTDGVMADITGKVDPITGVDVSGDVELKIAGFPLSAKVIVKITPRTQEIKIKGDVTIAGVKVSISGEEAVDYVKIGDIDNFPFPRVELTGSVNFKPDGFDLGSVSFSLIESYAVTGFTASSNFTLGPLSASGDLTFYVTDNDEIGFDIDSKGTLNLGSTSLGTSFRAGNCVPTSSSSSGGSNGISNIGKGSGALTGIGGTGSTTTSQCASIKSTSLKGKATFTTSGYSFTTGWFNFDLSGSFTETVSISGSDDDTPKDLKAEFSYSINGTISSKSPYISTSESASVEVYVRIDKKWKEVFSGSEGVSISLSPFKVSVTVSIKDIGKKSFSIS